MNPLSLVWLLTLMVQLLGLALLRAIWRWPYSYPRWRYAWGCLACAIALVLLRTVVMLLRALDVLAPMDGLWTVAAAGMPLLTSGVATLAIWQFRQIYSATLPHVHGPLLATITLDMQGRIVEWDATATQMFGWTAEESLGESLATRVLADPTVCSPVERWLTLPALPSQPSHVVCLARHRAGQTFPISVTVAHVLLADGTPVLRGSLCRLTPI